MFLEYSKLWGLLFAIVFGLSKQAEASIIKHFTARGEAKSLPLEWSQVGSSTRVGSFFPMTRRLGW